MATSFLEQRPVWDCSASPRSISRGVFDPYVRAQYFPVKESELSAFCSANGWSQLAILYALEALRLSTVPCPEVFMNLSVYYEETGDRERALRSRTRTFD